jgi:uncharacterized membrane protein YeaQ/YmgE (transglycosylase-associated protein family)
MAVAALVLGILGTLFSLSWLTVWVGAPLAILALVLGVLARKQLTAENKPTGMATAGMVLGIVGTALAVLIFAICASCAAAVGTASKQIANEAEKAAEQQKNKEFDEAFKKAIDESKKSPEAPQPK